MLHAAAVRSPHARARIRSIDASRARALRGVHLVLTAAELGALNQPTPLLIPHPELTHARTPYPLAGETNLVDRERLRRPRMFQLGEGHEQRRRPV